MSNLSSLWGVKVIDLVVSLAIITHLLGDSVSKGRARGKNKAFRYENLHHRSGG